MACFYVTITGNFERFQFFNFETNFLQNKSFSKNWSVICKLKVLRFSCKTALSEPNVKSNRKRLQNGPSQKTEFYLQLVFVLDCFFSLSKDVKEQPVIKSWFDVPTTQMIILFLCVFRIARTIIFWIPRNYANCFSAKFPH